MNSTFDAINIQPNLAETAYTKIRDAIIRGKIESGQRLVYRTLAAEFGISPTPVRDAIQRLASEGAVSLDDRGVASVMHMTPDSYSEITQLRIMLEGMAAEKVALMKDNRAILQRLEEIHGRLAAHKLSGDVEGALFDNEQFHFEYISSAALPVTEHLLRSLWLRCGPSLRFIYTSTEPSPPPQTHPHLRLLEAIRQHDGQAAREAVQEDIRRASNLILKKISAQL